MGRWVRYTLRADRRLFGRDSPPARAHGILCARLAGELNAALRSRRPWTAQTEAGTARPDLGDSCYIADLAVTCWPYKRGEQLVEDPILIVEVFSPGTERHDRQTKVPAYLGIESVQQILLIHSETAHAEIFRRRGAAWFSEIVRGREAELHLASIELQLAMSELYEGIDLPSETANLTNCLFN